MKPNRVFNDNGQSFNKLLTQLAEAKLVKLANQKYNSGKDIAAIKEEDK